ncbi:ParB family protein [Acidovorax sp. NCPPB 3576]|uniref:ParB family protein n=1 Tax=Acidovorax sp. NCPPB 3576 TaxID=2940488 RepID=UPI00234BBE96|nr:ParB family protein [Acidovorax sp. NCPPB 3576]WCM90601.1 hypothetical protein M5C98_11530 [Acidovorax sp. NCPPB 3576]
MPSHTPETLTAAQRAERLRLSGHDAGPSTTQDATMSTETKNPPKASTKNEKYREQARAALSLPPLRNATEGLDPRSDMDMSFSLFSVHDIEPYEYNPRTQPNPLYDEIKASIQADGITNAITVTRRPGQDKYTTYGGGNTRLMIAKELFKAGDQRFARLHVIVKAWAGHARTIAAHLAENKMRGDISFWENAQGVQTFKTELEKERGRPLTASELNSELKAMGLNFGIRVLQNLAFAVEHLAPVGPWLRATEVNTVVRPLVGALHQLGERLGRRVEAQQAIQETLHRHASSMAAQAAAKTLQQQQAGGEEKATPPTLDVPLLVQDLHETVATLLKLDARAVPAMISALESDAHISAETLRQVKVAPPAAAPVLAPVPTPHQPPLAGMLAPVPAARAPAPSAAPTGPAARPSVPAYAPDLPAPVPDSSLLIAESPNADLQGLVLEHLSNLNNVVPLHDILCAVQTMPFGYLADLPEQDIAHANGQALPDAQVVLRAALWKVLAALSGQYDRRITATITDVNASRWTQAVARGPQGFEEACLEAATVQVQSLDGQPAIALPDLYQVLAAPDVGFSLTRLMAVMERIRLNHPERFLPGWEPLF